MVMVPKTMVSTAGVLTMVALAKTMVLMIAKNIAVGAAVSLFAAAAAGCHHSGFASVSLCAAVVLIARGGRCRWFL